MAHQKKLEAAAKKALKKAKESVSDAQEKADKASKKRQRKAAELRADLRRITAKTKLEKAQLADAKAAAVGGPAKRAVIDDLPLPLPHAVTVAVPTGAGPAESSDLTALSMIRLRELARAKNIVGYSRLSKAALIERLVRA